MNGNKIKELRELNNLTQGKLAKLMGFKSASAIGMIERNEREAGNELLIKLAKYFNVSTDYLLTTEEKLEKTEKKLDVANGALAEVANFLGKVQGNSVPVMDDNIYSIISKYQNEKFTKEETTEIVNFINFVISKRI